MSKSYRPVLKLDSFPIETVRRLTSSYNKTFHSKLFTLFSSSESDIYHFAYCHKPNFGFCFTLLKNDEGRWYQGGKELEETRDWVLKQAQTSTKSILDLHKKWEKHWKQYLQMCAKLDRTNLEKLTLPQFYACFEAFHKKYLEVGSIAYIADCFMSTGTEDWLEQLISKELAQAGVANAKIMQYVRTLTSPVHLSFTLNAEYELLKTAQAIITKYKTLPPITAIKSDKLLLKQLVNLERSFHWIQNNYYNVHYITTDEFYDEIFKIVEEAKKNKRTISDLLHEKEKELARLRENRADLMQSLPLSTYAKNVLDIARLFSKWKDIRKSGVYIGMHYFDRFLEEVARRTGYSKRQVTFLIFDEMKDVLFNKKKMIEELAKREQQCFYAVTSEGYFLVSGPESEKYFSVSKQKDQSNLVELRGVVASQGYARGRVRVIRKTEEMKDFVTGEILVANQTTPEFMPIMTKAAAIVTEQGGITSHAAIVARELGKPCIIGTKIATSVLKTGEIVEVDAHNGIVRRET